MPTQIKPLNTKAKRQLIKDRLLIAGELSNRNLAKMIGCSPSTIASVRRELAENNEQFGHRHTPDDSWARHPYFLANKDILLAKQLSVKSLRALRADGVLDKMAEINSLSPRYAQRLLYKERLLANKDNGFTVSEEDVRIFQADIRTGLPEIATGSVSLCFVDIPYNKKAVEELTPHIAMTAARILSDGGSLLLMVGGSHLNTALELLCNTDKALRYQWVISYVCPRGTPLIQGRRVTTAVKHLIWMCRGKYIGPIQHDLIYSPPDKADKELHPWSQSVDGVKSILERWSSEGDTICDFMCGWSGSTAQAALELGGRKLILSDIDPLAVKNTKNLVAKMFGSK